MRLSGRADLVGRGSRSQGAYQRGIVITQPLEREPLADYHSDRRKKSFGGLQGHVLQAIRSGANAPYHVQCVIVGCERTQAGSWAGMTFSEVTM
jgi:hypothetical protein